MDDVSYDFSRCHDDDDAELTERLKSTQPAWTFVLYEVFYCTIDVMGVST